MRKLRRILQVIGVALRHAVAPRLLRRRRAAPAPVRLHAALEELGGAWIKLGQALALRFDLLPDAYCYELFKLLNEVQPFGYAQVRRTIKDDLGRWPEEIFRAFEERPFASASIGQVHRAELRSGRSVAVKVQRPGIRRLIGTDIELMYLFARLSDRLGLWGATRSVEVVDEFARWTWQELDYRIEASQAATLGANARGDRLERNARVFSRYTSSRVLTTELVEGVPLIDVLYALRDRDERYLRAFEADGHDLTRIARNILWNAMNQIYRCGFFHADLHPANLFVLPGDAIGYVDFGIVGRLSNPMRESLASYARRLFEGDVDGAVAEFMQWIAPSERTQFDSAREELTRATEQYLLTLQNPRGRAASGGVSVLEVEVLRIIRRHHLRLASSSVAYLKAVVTSTTVIYALDRHFDLVSHEKRFHRRVIAQEVSRSLEPHNAARLAFDFGVRLSRMFDTVDALQSTEARFEQAAARVRRHIQVLAVIAGATGVSLYLLLRRPDAASAMLGADARDWLPAVLLGALVVLVAAMVREGRKLPNRERRARAPGLLTSAVTARFSRR